MHTQCQELSLEVLVNPRLILIRQIPFAPLFFQTKRQKHRQGASDPHMGPLAAQWGAKLDPVSGY